MGAVNAVWALILSKVVNQNSSPPPVFSVTAFKFSIRRSPVVTIRTRMDLAWYVSGTGRKCHKRCSPVYFAREISPPVVTALAGNGAHINLQEVVIIVLPYAQKTVAVRHNGHGIPSPCGVRISTRSFISLRLSVLSSSHFRISALRFLAANSMVMRTSLVASRWLIVCGRIRLLFRMVPIQVIGNSASISAKKIYPSLIQEIHKRLAPLAPVAMVALHDVGNHAYSADAAGAELTFSLRFALPSCDGRVILICLYRLVRLSCNMRCALCLYPC